MNLFMSYVLMFSISANLWAHGEDKIGPHKGFIRMPGAYHTEILQTKKNEVRVYFLDIQWKDQSIKDTVLQVNHQGDKSEQAACAPKSKDYYICSFSESINLNKPGTLIVNTQVKDQKGAEVSYALPLKLQTNGNSHSGHH